MAVGQAASRWSTVRPRRLALHPEQGRWSWGRVAPEFEGSVPMPGNRKYVLARLSRLTTASSAFDDCGDDPEVII